jgi:hypothetical protein
MGDMNRDLAEAKVDPGRGAGHEWSLDGGRKKTCSPASGRRGGPELPAGCSAWTAEGGAMGGRKTPMSNREQGAGCWAEMVGNHGRAEEQRKAQGPTAMWGRRRHGSRELAGGCCCREEERQGSCGGWKFLRGGSAK